MILGDFNARTNTLEDFISKDGNNFINDTSENCLQPKNRLNFENQINNHGKQLINLCKNCDMKILNRRTKGDSFGRATFHGNNGISVVDYIICDQELFRNTNYFVVKPPTYSYLTIVKLLHGLVSVRQTKNQTPILDVILK